MYLDVQDLRNFYYRSALGRAAQKVIRDQLVSMWPGAAGQTVAGYGFAAPLLRPYLAGARRVIALMPGPQGVMPWPPGQPNVAVLCEESLWPLATGIVDRLVLLHGLEVSDHPGALLEECWRVLGPGGRAVFIVPNRAGPVVAVGPHPLWSWPPYSPGQLEAQLKQHGFAVERSLSTLYQPPVRPADLAAAGRASGNRRASTCRCSRPVAWSLSKCPSRSLPRPRGPSGAGAAKVGHPAAGGAAGNA
jgi:SAM-dependent methyltransferase